MFPDKEFLTLTLSQEGVLSAREAGKGNNSPSWHGAYFTDGSRWFMARTGDLIISQIDLWKGCISIIDPEYDGAIVTQEFPLYEVDRSLADPLYLTLLLRTKYYRRAIRAITTGHSNRRRTQQDDFLNLRVFLPDRVVQERIGQVVVESQRLVGDAARSHRTMLEEVEGVIMGTKDPDGILRAAEAHTTPTTASLEHREPAAH